MTLPTLSTRYDLPSESSRRLTVCLPRSPRFHRSQWFAAVWLPAGLIALVVLLVVLAGCGATSTNTGNASTGATATSVPATVAPTAPAASTPVANPKVSITGSGGYYSSFGFMPGSITIKVGATVVWTNNTTVQHTVTSDSGTPVAFDSGMITAQGGTFKFTFTTAGTYTYHCNVHPSMHGTIIVVPA